MCPRCRAPVPDGALACPNCGLFVYANELAQISAEALRQESTNPWNAAEIWRQGLGLIPPNSSQFQEVQNRIAMLSSGGVPPPPPSTRPLRPPKPQETLGVAILKTGGSMVVSIIVYAFYFQDALGGDLTGSAIFAAAFVVLMLVHEMGHVIANRFYGIRASPPIFIPFMGAVINLRQRPANAKVEAVIGIGGPVLGTVGALVAYGIYLATGNQIALASAHLAFLLNLFNLLPVPPLDGGRVTAAMSPWIWTLGLAGLAWMFIADLRHGFVNYILILVVIFALPRIKNTLQGRARFADYYKISRAASWTIGTVYVALGVALIILFQATSLR